MTVQSVKWILSPSIGGHPGYIQALTPPSAFGGRLSGTIVLELPDGSRKLSRRESLDNEVVGADDLAAGHKAFLMRRVAHLRCSFVCLVLGVANGCSNPGE